MIKLLMHWQNDNNQNHLFDNKKSDLCPACDKETEDHMHFLSCPDKILRKENKKAWNKVVKTLQRMRTTLMVSRSIYIIVEALLNGECPQSPIFTPDTIGQLAKKAWKEQELIGWMHVAQGRLSKTWGEAQGVYYKMNPELRSKKYLSPLNWTKVMIGALIDMSLTMWKNRCGSLYG